MDAKAMTVMMLDSQLEILEKAKSAMLEGDFLTSGALLHAIGGFYERMAASMKPYAFIQYVMDQEESKKKQNALDAYLKEYYKQMELMINDTEGLSN